MKINTINISYSDLSFQPLPPIRFPTVPNHVSTDPTLSQRAVVSE